MTDTLNPKSNYRILIVDDDHKSRAAMGWTLSAAGYEISHASSGTEAIALHNHAPFDLVIAELERDGFKVLRELGRHPTPVKLVATSRNSWLPAGVCQRMAQHLGASHVLTKPFQPEQLLDAVRGALG
jgi:DNA-binding response OmpR family regulator